MSSAEEHNKALVRRFTEEVYNRGNLDVADELLAPDFVDHGQAAGEEGHIEAYKRWIADMRAASSDFHMSIEEQIAEGEKVVTRLISSGTLEHSEPMGLASTGTYIVIEYISIDRVVEGKIVEERTVSDDSPVWQQRLEQEALARERIEQDLRVARTIQQASLPKEVPQLEGWQITPYYQPAREVGGDFYDFHLLSGGRLGLVVGDARRCREVG
jgi:predicted ester cyclase